MARLENILPPGEIVRWRSPKVIRPRRLLGRGAAYLAFAAVVMMASSRSANLDEPFYVAVAVSVVGLLWLWLELSPTASEVAVTEQHLVWADAALLFGGGHGMRRLRDIRAVDLEDGAALVNLYCDSENTSFELPDAADPEMMARSIARPARIWRKSTSRMGKLAWRWQGYCAAIGAIAAVLPVFGVVELADLFFDSSAIRDTAGRVAVLAAIILAVVFVLWAAEFGRHILPHFLVGRRLVGGDRLDFVGALTDPRWQGLNPEGRNMPKLQSRLAEWAMRKAYGEIPDLSAYGPEILIPGEFPEE